MKTNEVTTTRTTGWSKINQPSCIPRRKWEPRSSKNLPPHNTKQERRFPSRLGPFQNKRMMAFVTQHHKVAPAFRMRGGQNSFQRPPTAIHTIPQNETKPLRIRENMQRPLSTIQVTQLQASTASRSEWCNSERRGIQSTVHSNQPPNLHTETAKVAMARRSSCTAPNKDVAVRMKAPQSVYVRIATAKQVSAATTGWTSTPGTENTQCLF